MADHLQMARRATRRAGRERAVMERRPLAMFVGDALGLDFLNSIATPVDTPVDWIKDGEGLLDWVEQARLAPPEALDSVRMHALPGELEALGQAAQ